jgi:acylphosphatase
VTKRIVVRGRVQGVFFRDSVCRRALELNVKGWVTNRSDGAVEAVFDGTLEAVEQMVEFVRRGPGRAEVETVEVFEEPTSGLGDFRIR